MTSASDRFDIDGDPAAGRLLARNWGWVALRGALLVLLGVLALLFPGPALFSFALIFAAFCFVNGIFALVAGIRGATHKRERWGALVLSGLLGIAVGVVFAIFPILGTLTYALTMIALVAGWAIITGVLEIVAAWRLRRAIRGEWLLMLSGALSVLLGIGLYIMLWMAPAPTLLSVGWLIGIWALIGGIALIVLAFRLRSHARETSGTEAASAE